MKEAFGYASIEWKRGIDWDAVRAWRRAARKDAMERHGLGAMLLMYDENIRYVTSTLTPGWNRLKPGLRYACFVEGKAPILYEQGDIGIHIKAHSPWIPQENVRHSFAWIKGAAGPASQMQVDKFIDALVGDLEDAGVKDKPLGVDFIDINMMKTFERAGITWTDGMTPMMEARAIKSPDEQNARASSGRSATRSTTRCRSSCARVSPRTRSRHTGSSTSTRFPGVEDVEDVIVSSGPNAWPNWRNFSDRIIRPGELVIIDVAALTWNGFKSCVYRTYCVGGKPTDEMKRYYDDGAHVAPRLDRRGETGRDDARHRLEVAVGDGDVGLRGRGRGGREPLGPRARARAVRPAGDLADLVARSPDRDQARHGVRARDAARQGARLRRAARGDADRDRRRATS